MQSRLSEFQAAVSQLTLAEVQNALNFAAWCNTWGTYVEGILATQDRPPVKPPHG